MIRMISFNRLMEKIDRSISRVFAPDRLLLFFLDNVFDVHRNGEDPTQDHEQWQHPADGRGKSRRDLSLRFPVPRRGTDLSLIQQGYGICCV